MQGRSKILVACRVEKGYIFWDIPDLTGGVKMEQLSSNSDPVKNGLEIVQLFVDRSGLWSGRGRVA